MGRVSETAQVELKRKWTSVRSLPCGGGGGFICGGGGGGIGARGTLALGRCRTRALSLLLVGTQVWGFGFIGF